MRMPASLAVLWGSTAFWVQQLGLWPCRTPPLGLGTVSLLLPWAFGGCAVTSDPVRSEGRAGPSGWAQSPGLESPGWGGFLEHHVGGPLEALQGLRPPYTLTRAPGAQAKRHPLFSTRARWRAHSRSWTRGGGAPAAVLSAGPGGALGRGRRRTLWFAVMLVCLLRGEAHGLVC